VSAVAGNQLVLGFEHRPALGEESFLIADSNRDAVAWLDRWPDWPGRVLAVHGPPGSGKTHLSHVWQRRSSAMRLEAGELGSDFLEAWPGKGTALVIEDGDQGIDETALFHVINLVREDQGYLLLTAREAPARWPVGLPDLGSRLSALTAVRLGPPDDVLIAAVLTKQFQDRQLRVPDDVVAYLVARMERSFAVIGQTVAAVDTLSLAERRAITVPLARRVLEASQSELDLGDS
jgi:chromosomal replication initiation ATPase DnaA